MAAAAVNHAMDIYIKSQYTAKARAVHRTMDQLRQREKDLRKTDSIQPALRLLNLNLGVKFYYQRSATLEEIAHVSLEYSKKKYNKFINKMILKIGMLSIEWLVMELIALMMQ